MSPLLTATLRSRYCPFRTTPRPPSMSIRPGRSFLRAPEDEELQIPALGKGDPHRMVWRLASLLQHREIGPRLDGRFPDGGKEVFGRHARGAACGGEDASRTKHA